MKHSKANPGRRLLLFLGVGVMLSALPGGGKAETAAPGACDLQLTLELTPDVPNPSDVGFLSSLLGNHPEYRLILQGRDDQDDILVELTGPGPDYLCRDVIQTMRRDGRILSVHLNQGSS
jgi:hypothetical protein